MKTISLKKLGTSVLVFGALLVSTLVVGLHGQQANAASYAGPVYSSYEACDNDRVRWQSSFTRASTCYVAYGWDSNTQQNVYLGYSFTVTERTY